MGCWTASRNSRPWPTSCRTVARRRPAPCASTATSSPRWSVTPRWCRSTTRQCCAPWRHWPSCDPTCPSAALRTVICHLGSGTSVCGVRHGRSVEISSAFTPQSGTPMSTRSGDFDPFVLTYLLEHAGLTVEQLNERLTRESGLAGLSGVGGDLRDIEAAAAQGNGNAQLAIEVFVWNIRRWIGSCLMATGGLDALAFTGGIGENDALLRELVCRDLDWIGLRLDRAANLRGAEGIISAADSAVAVVTVNTDEEIVVARDAYAVLTGIKEEKA
ncbi:MAG: hypothetical protein HZB16_18485 [Armatimonadetes bacterium]|nr:hypothetical protein [Armatimonadota bacterium]